METSVHPHACGEHDFFQRPNRLAAGSSPRLWGTPSHGIELAAKNRFIPTPVGNTLDRGQSNFQSSVHPHACGEHTSSNPPGLQHLLDSEIATG